MLKNGNLDPINIPEMLAYVPAPWIRHGIQMKGLGVRFTLTQTFRHLEDLGKLKHHKSASFIRFLIFEPNWDHELLDTNCSYRHVYQL